MLNPNNRKFTGIKSDPATAIDFVGVREPQTSHHIAFASLVAWRMVFPFWEKL